MIGGAEVRRLAHRQDRVVGGRGHANGGGDEVRPVLGLGELHLTVQARRGAPGDGHLMGRISGQVENDPLRLHRRRRYRAFGRLDRRWFGAIRTLRLGQCLGLGAGGDAQGRDSGPEHEGANKHHFRHPQKT